MPIYDNVNTLITKRVESAISRPDVIEIQNRTLDGQYHLQTIGTGATVLDVTAHFTMPQKILLDACKKTSTPLKVIFDQRYYTGPISDEVKYNRTPSPNGSIFTATFLLLVQTEGVV